MPQNVKRIDVTKSFFVTDPNSVMENLGYTGREDDPLDPPPIIAYEGYNFIPTSYGYRSYFGANSKLDIALLDQTSHHCDKMLIFQLANYFNIIIALCDDGIWYTKSTSVQGSVWVQGVAMTAPTSPTVKEWTYCMIKNVLYLYRQGEASYHKISYTDYTTVAGGVTLTFTAVVPTFLTMAGQIGIFRANSSLGFWDSANSIAWSNPLDLQDFTPSLVTMAGNAIFNGILGRIVTVKSQGDNFIVYTTKGIVGVRYISSTTMIWEATTITDTAGIRTSKEVTNSITEMEHYAYTNTGIKKIGSYNALSKVHQFEDIIPEIYDFMRESDTNVSPITRSIQAASRWIPPPIVPPSSGISANHIYLDFLNGRYLFICCTSNRIIDGLVSATLQVVRSLYLNILVNGLNWPGLILPKDIIIIDPDDGPSSMPLYIQDKRATDPDYNDDMYLVWRPTGKGTFANQVTPLNDYVLDSVGNHVPNINNKTTATVPAIAVNAKDLSLAQYYNAVTPTYPDHMDDLGYRGYGSIAAGTAWLGVMDTSLLAYAQAQELEWTNLGLIQAANKARFDSVSSSPGVEQAISGIRYRTNDIGIRAEIDADIAAYIVGRTDGEAIGNPGSSNRSIRYTEESLDIPTTLNSVNSGNTFSGVGTNAAIYTLTKTLKKAYTIKRSTTIVNIRVIYKRQKFTVIVPAFHNMIGKLENPVEVSVDQVWVSSSDNAWQALLRQLTDVIINAAFFPDTAPGLGTNYTHATNPVHVRGASGNPLLDSIAVYRDLDGIGGFQPNQLMGYISVAKNASSVMPSDPGLNSIQGTFLNGSGTSNPATCTHLGTVTFHECSYVTGGSQSTGMLNSDIADIDVPLTMTAYQSNVTWYLEGTDPGEPDYMTEAPEAGYDMSTQDVDYNQISASSILTPVDFGYTYPGTTFLMQNGIPAPYYPTYVGALVLDTALKKWGKMKADFKTLLDYSPFNSASGDVISYSNLGVDMGILKADGYIYNMDAKPLDSYMKYGKIGYFRKGYTYLEEVKVHFRLPSTGNVKLSGSLSGVTLDKELEAVHPFTNVLNINCYGHIAAKWHTIEISGNYDIQYMEYRGTLSSRR